MRLPGPGIIVTRVEILRSGSDEILLIRGSGTAYVPQA